MKDIANNREILDLHRSNSMLIRQIGEVRNRIIAIEEYYGSTVAGCLAGLTQNYQAYNQNEDIVIMRGINHLLHKELSKYRERHNQLKK